MKKSEILFYQGFRSFPFHKFVKIFSLEYEKIVNWIVMIEKWEYIFLYRKIVKYFTKFSIFLTYTG
ncbi:hypothetical protein C0971_07195 [Bacillus methanolicus]|nr:hypothetical protein C0971_07195 [Bacillus methanolicus]